MTHDVPGPRLGCRVVDLTVAEMQEMRCSRRDFTEAEVQLFCPQVAAYAVMESYVPCHEPFVSFSEGQNNIKGHHDMSR